MKLPEFLLGTQRKRERDLLANLNAEAEALDQTDNERKDRMRQYRDESEAHRDCHLDADVYDYGRAVDLPDPRRHRIRMPYGLAEATKHTYRASGKLPDVTADRADTSPREMWRQSCLEKALAYSWEKSSAQNQISDAAWDGSITGAYFFEVSWDPKMRCAKFRAVAPETVSVVPSADDPTRLARYYRSWRAPMASVKQDYQGKKTGYNPQDLTAGEQVEASDFVRTGDITEGENIGGVQMVLVRQMVDGDRLVRWTGDVLLDYVEHGYGFTPGVGAPNLGPQRMLWGYSDWEFVRSVARYYESLFSRQADVVALVCRTLIVDKGSGIAPELVKRALEEGGVLPIKKDGVLETLDVSDQPAFIKEHIAMAREALNDLGFTPSSAWGNQAGASGSERALSMLPQIELTKLKQINLGWALERVNEHLLQLFEKYHLDLTTYRGSQVKGGVRKSYSVQLGPGAPQPPASEFPQQMDDSNAPVQYPTRLDQLIDGHYCTRITFNDRLDVHDPQFVLTELNKFGQGVQSAQTTLANLGVQNPEDELKLIEQEAQRFPWMNQGALQLVLAQIAAQQASQQEQDPGAPTPPNTGDPLSAAMGASGFDGGANNTDVLAAGLNGSENLGRTGPGVPGELYGGA